MTMTMFIRLNHLDQAIFFINIEQLNNTKKMAGSAFLLINLGAHNFMIFRKTKKWETFTYLLLDFALKNFKRQLPLISIMVHIAVVEFSREGHKIRKVIG